MAAALIAAGLPGAVIAAAAAWAAWIGRRLDDLERGRG